MADRPNEPRNHIFKPRVKSTAKAVDPNQLLYAEDLLHYYKFGLAAQSLQEVLQKWATTYPVEWIRPAIVEALYQGRYKIVSVEQILQLWQRRDQAQPRFDADFEQLIRKRLPQNLVQPVPEPTSAVAALAAEIQANSHLHHALTDSPASNSSLDDLAQFVQTRRSRQPSVDAVIDHAEARVDDAANAAKQSITHTSNESDSLATGGPRIDRSAPGSPITDRAQSQAVERKSIGQFTPTTSDSDMIAKLRSVSHPSDKTAS